MITIIDWLKKQFLVRLFVIYLRYLTGFAFVFASIIKIKGERFTLIPPTEPVGYFFEAMYQSGFYWNFLGWAQFISGALLMSQRFSTIGALVFLPVITNVCLITHSVDFGSGTPVITTLMLLGTIFLVFWDYKKWIILFKKDHTIYLDLRNEPEDRLMNDPVWIAAGMLFVFFTVAFQLSGGTYAITWVVSMLATGIIAFIWVMLKHKRKLAS
ncbi:hypothetical protein SanaruYs_10300 [Chryseotalea sanaruensis]|uniref:DoxX family protein n=1 Tax=Chryseotalea sanaruensis TaxID=2482724 RepID=A0A401U7E2_9BACT|nr:hypothetical protein [Chryseotalea sanaruensis]GCC50812.1 hypothetical protein SanaruYs_10300 [Chryseotalea sanaruensis]